MAERKASVERNTLETQVKVDINLDGTGQSDFDIGVPFLEHMLDQIARHGLIDMQIKSRGDLHIDDHHTVEDVGITLGMAFAKAIGDKKGIRRYGHAYVAHRQSEGGQYPPSDRNRVQGLWPRTAHGGGRRCPYERHDALYQRLPVTDDCQPSSGYRLWHGQPAFGCQGSGTRRRDAR